jgi:hypothetical protein
VGESANTSTHAFDPLEEERKRLSRANRATWWPLPRSSILEEKGENHEGPIYGPNVREEV